MFAHVSCPFSPPGPCFISYKSPMSVCECGPAAARPSQVATVGLVGRSMRELRHDAAETGLSKPVLEQTDTGLVYKESHTA